MSVSQLGEGGRLLWGQTYLSYIHCLQRERASPFLFDAAAYPPKWEWEMGYPGRDEHLDLEPHDLRVSVERAGREGSLFVDQNNCCFNDGSTTCFPLLELNWMFAAGLSGSTPMSKNVRRYKSNKYPTKKKSKQISVLLPKYSCDMSLYWIQVIVICSHCLLTMYLFSPLLFAVEDLIVICYSININ